MNCPKDRIPLEIVHFHSIPIHRCLECEGTWYQRDQLQILKDKEAHGDYCWINLDLWRDAAKFRAAPSSRYTCPADGTPLTLSGNLRYQACDSKICYPPATVPVSWQLTVVPLNTERAPEEIRHK